MKIFGLGHVQLAMPKGQEDSARKVYGELLGLKETAKPVELASRGGVWFECGALQLHLGVEDPFAPARTAHPALRLVGYEAFVAKLERVGVDVKAEQSVPSQRRAFVADLFGNRVELVDGGSDG